MTCCKCSEWLQGLGQHQQWPKHSSWQLAGQELLGPWMWLSTEELRTPILSPECEASGDDRTGSNQEREGGSGQVLQCTWGRPSGRRWSSSTEEHQCGKLASCSTCIGPRCFWPIHDCQGYLSTCWQYTAGAYLPQPGKHLESMWLVPLQWSFPTATRLATWMDALAGLCHRNLLTTTMLMGLTHKVVRKCNCHRVPTFACSWKANSDCSWSYECSRRIQHGCGLHPRAARVWELLWRNCWVLVIRDAWWLRAFRSTAQFWPRTAHCSWNWQWQFGSRGTWCHERLHGQRLEALRNSWSSQSIIRPYSWRKWPTCLWHCWEGSLSWRAGRGQRTNTTGDREVLKVVHRTRHHIEPRFCSFVTSVGHPTKGFRTYLGGLFATTPDPSRFVMLRGGALNQMQVNSPKRLQTFLVGSLIFWRMTLHFLSSPERIGTMICLGLLLGLPET